MNPVSMTKIYDSLSQNWRVFLLQWQNKNRKILNFIIVFVNKVLVRQ